MTKHSVYKCHHMEPTRGCMSCAMKNPDGFDGSNPIPKAERLFKCEGERGCQKFKYLTVQCKRCKQCFTCCTCKEDDETST